MYTQLEQRGMEEPPVNVSTLTKMKIDGEPIACLTAYDASFALLVDRAGTDLILVGDSLGMVIQGHDTTVPVTVEDIIYHTRTVTRGLRRAFLVADMPFMSYSSKAQALDNAVRLMQEGGAMMVKLEGGAGQISIVEHLAHHDIPVCAHIGLRPQSVHKIGGFKVQGRAVIRKKPAEWSKMRLRCRMQVRTLCCWNACRTNWGKPFKPLSTSRLLALAPDRMSMGRFSSSTIFWVLPTGVCRASLRTLWRKPIRQQMRV
jgi:hypothetical protein